MMQQETIIRETIPADVDLIEYRLRRLDSGDGIKLTAKSPVLAKFFSGIKDPKEPTVKIKQWGGLECYRLLPARVPDIPDVDFTHLGESLLLPEFGVNLSFLRATALGEGIVISQEGLFLNSQLDTLWESIRHGVRTLYKDYIRQWDAEVTLTSRERRMVA